MTRADSHDPAAPPRASTTPGPRPAPARWPAGWPFSRQRPGSGTDVGDDAPVRPGEALTQSLRRALARIGALVGHGLNAQGSLEGAFGEIDDRAGIVMERVAQFRATSDAAQQTTARGVQGHRESLDVLSQSTHAGLDSLSRDLDERLRHVGTVLDGLHRSGKQLEILAVNASIQAARSGEAGRAFGVLAQAMRELAEASSAEARQVSNLLDFTPFQARFSGFKKALGEGLDECSASLAATFEDIGETQRSLTAQIDAIEAATRVVPDMLGSARDALDRGRRVLGAAAADGEVLLAAAGGGREGPLAQAALRIGSPTGGPEDLLDQIRARGVLRVAVEPRFWGLSFRRQAGAELAGLDVDWARAFAHALGVRVAFVERPWVECPSLLIADGSHRPGPASLPEADLMWSALLPASNYHGLAFSRPYQYLHFVLARRRGDSAVTGLKSLQGRTLGCINDPAVFDVLRQEGVAWGRHAAAGRGVRLANLIAYGNLTDIFNALAEGRIDAFPVDQPLAGWTCGSPDSPWAGRLEILPVPITREPWHYAVGVRADPAGLALLREVNRFIGTWKGSAAQRDALRRWAVADTEGRRSYRDEPGNLVGEAELAAR